MSQADKSAAKWLCLAGLLLFAIITVVHWAASNPPISAPTAGLAFVMVTSFSLSIGAILFGLATERI